MAAEVDLTGRLTDAIKSYEASWKPVDSERALFIATQP